MPGLTWSRSISVLGASLVLVSAPFRADAQIRFDLQAQPLAAALTTVGNLANTNVLFDSVLVDGLRAPPLEADLSVDDALARLLTGTQLHVIRVNENTVSVVNDADAKRAQSAHGADTAAAYALTGVHLAYAGVNGGGGQGDNLSDMSAGKSRPNRTDKDSGANESDSGPNKRDMAEVLVTAEKRTERLQDVPVPVTAINTDSLLESNQLSLQDYYTSVPGLALSMDNLRGQVNVSIRGLSLNGASPTVGIVVDDIPYGASTSLGGGNWMPDLDPSDLARVEVLRGPQGTLYGASSIGGLLKYATVDPSTEATTGTVQASGSGIRNGSGLGYSVRGSVNVPLSDTLAMRVSGFTRQDPGYIDDPILHIDGVNKVEAYGGLVSTLWRPTHDLSLKVSALLQETKRFGSADVDILPGLGDLQNNYVPGTGRYNRRVEVYSANLTAKLGLIDLTSVTGYSRNKLKDSYDLSVAFACCTPTQFGVAGTPLFENSNTDKFTQEIRLSMPIGQKVEWLLGGFYTHERSPHDQLLAAADSTTGSLVGQWLYATIPTTYEEYAAFTDVTLHLTDQFDIQVGARESHDSQTYSEVDSGPYVDAFQGVPSPNIFPKVDSKDNSFTYLVTPRFKVSADLMAYARFASGYQPGGPNTGAPTGVPLTFGPSKARDYEVGVKGNALNHLLSFDASLYYIDLKQIQLSLTNPTTYQGYLANGGAAKSQGVELSIQSRPMTGLSIDGWVTWNDARLTEDFPPDTSTVYGVSRDRLPFSSKFSGNLSLEQEFPLWGEVTGFVGGAVSYTGHRLGNFASIFAGSPQRQDYPAYARTDLRAGMRYDSWTVNLFVNNLTDRRGLILGGLDATPTIAYDYITPRTVGVSLAKRFNQ